VLNVPAADLDSTVDKVYDIQGSSGHTHTVLLTVANLRQLKDGVAVTVESSVGSSHSHTVTTRCA
jgi:hypothetical protein